jgi:hypothetical protein
VKFIAAGLLAGWALAYVILHLGKETRLAQGRKTMTAEEKFTTRVREIVADRPEMATPDHNFLRDWAYGNAGLEDERITIDQVESVIRSTLAKSA